jgi:NAD(P)H-flavin reductase
VTGLVQAPARIVSEADNLDALVPFRQSLGRDHRKWDATIVSHEPRAFDIAVLRLALSEPLPYRPGQTISVESQKAPRYWRFYSMASRWRDPCRD